MKHLISKILYSIPLSAFLLSASSPTLAGGDIIEWNYPTVWHGLYGGIHIGYGEGNYEGYFDGAELPERVAYANNLDLAGLIGGLHIGYNWQRHNIVYGIEADISGSNIDATATDAVADTGDRIEGEIDLLASIRGRLGLVSRRTYLYATAGLAFADASYSAIANNGTSSGKVEFEETGYVFGGGIEKILSPDGIRLKLEGLYYKFDKTVDTSSLNTASDNGDFVKFDNIWTVRAGLSVPLDGYSRRSYK